MYTQITHKRQTAVLSVAILYLCCQAGVLGQSDCPDTLKPVPIQLEEGQTDSLSYTDDSVIMCSDGNCGKLSLESIQKAYPDAFTSEKVACTWGPSITGAHCGGFWSDNDGCCPTWRYITIYQGLRKNIFGRMCYILKIPFIQLYQYMSVGICGWPRKCDGKCTQQYTVQSMLAWCPGYGGIKMHHFRIPTYCACQKTSG